MIRFFFYAVAALALNGIGGCKKDALAAPSNEIIGSWDWVASSGGLTGRQTHTPASTGIATTWVFKSDGTFQQYDTQQGTSRLVESTTFSLGSTHSIYTGQPTRSLTINRHADGPTGTAHPVTYVIQAVGERLEIADNNPDGFGYTYRRK